MSEQQVPPSEGPPRSTTIATAVLVVGGVVAAAILAFVVFFGWFLPAFGRGEFFTASFNLDQARAYVGEIRSAGRDWDAVGTVVELPPQYEHLSVGGEAVIWVERGTGALHVGFWARRGIQTSDEYVFVEQGTNVGCADQTSITEIGPHWYFVQNCG